MQADSKSEHRSVESSVDTRVKNSTAGSPDGDVEYITAEDVEAENATTTAADNGKQAVKQEAVGVDGDDDNQKDNSLTNDSNVAKG